MPTRRELTLQNKKDPRTDVGSGIFFLLCKLRCIEDKLNNGQNTGAEAVFIGMKSLQWARVVQPFSSLREP